MCQEYSGSSCKLPAGGGIAGDIANLPISQADPEIGEACNALARDRPCTATLFTTGASPRFAPATARGDVSPGEVRSVLGVIIDRYSS
jgi:hypothetical protein